MGNKSKRRPNKEPCSHQGMLRRARIRMFRIEKSLKHGADRVIREKLLSQLDSWRHLYKNILVRG